MTLRASRRTASSASSRLAQAPSARPSASSPCPDEGVLTVVVLINSKNDYTSKHSNAGAIAGGVVGGLAVILLILALLFFLRRRRQRAVNRTALPTSDALGRRGSKTPSLDPDDRPLTDGPADLMRAGTYNLGSVRFTEQSLEHLRAMDRPPAYERARDAAADPPPPPPALALEGVVTERRRSSADDEITEVAGR